MSRPRKITDESKLLIALMSSEQGMSNKAIGESLKLSESAVSKALKECFEEGRLKLVFNRNGLTAKQLAALQATAEGAEELKRRLARFAKDASAVVTEPDVRIFDSGSVAATPEGWASRLETFGRAAAPYLWSLIAGSRAVGTSWGRDIGGGGASAGIAARAAGETYSAVRPFMRGDARRTAAKGERVESGPSTR